MAKEISDDDLKEGDIGAEDDSPQSSSEEDKQSHANRWDQMFSRLLAFKAKHGKS